MLVTWGALGLPARIRRYRQRLDSVLTIPRARVALSLAVAGLDRTGWRLLRWRADLGGIWAVCQREDVVAVFWFPEFSAVSSGWADTALAKLFPSV